MDFFLKLEFSILTMKKLYSLLALLCLFTFNSCSVYNFTGTGKIDAKTFEVKNFKNYAIYVEPGVDRAFTLELQNLIQNQTNLNFVNSDGDLKYEGEITDYRVFPTTATADQKAAQNRLSITVNVRFTNKNKESEDFEKPFSFFYDYSGDEQLQGSRLVEALDVIFERITQDIFNESLAKW